MSADFHVRQVLEAKHKFEEVRSARNCDPIAYARAFYDAQRDFHAATNGYLFWALSQRLA